MARKHRISSLLAGVVATVLVGIGALPALAFDHDGLAQRALERHIVPGYQRLVAAAAEQSAAIAAACEAPGDESTTAARGAFKDALLAWARVEHIRFGPITQHNRLDAMIFWPDPRGIARRQIARVLAQQDRDALSPEALAGKSIAIQGFSALDVVLFGSGWETMARSEPAGRFRCGYARALAANIASIASQTLASWSNPAGFADLWLKPADGNPAFLNAKETTHALDQAYLTGLKQVRNVRIGGVIGLKQQGVRALDPIVPSSGMALALIIANVEGLRALLIETGLADAVPEGAPARSVLRSVAVELDMTLARMRRIAGASSDAFRPDTARSQLMALGWPLRNAHDALSGAMAEAAGLSIGFNSLDGD
jgi:uncharacterized protein